ncbi:unnamed protein product [Caenorhabditis angaria]|uniref:IBR domain-containing protein n=1 Tax=Caenorhabditis angaria TaxID=860376 RepID=A0A9P1IVV6_9PELO|nr:unnamed protein product [Caenorhabditis angaria]
MNNKTRAQRGLPLPPFIKPVFMSVQDKNVGFDLNETEFPELSAKLTGRKEKGRRSAVAARHARQVEKAGAMLVKTIDDPHRVLGRRRVQRVNQISDGFATNVIYSLNKQNRWDNVTELELLVNNDDTLPVQIVERVMTAKDTTSNVVALHQLDDNDEVCVKTATGKGTNLNALNIGEGKKVRGRKARKEAEAEAEASSAEESSHEEVEDPKIQYTIYKPHKNHKVLAGKLFNRNYNTKKAGKTRSQQKVKINMDELEGSELEQSVHIEEPLYKPSRDFKFCLGDYITDSDKPMKNDLVYVRRESIESVNQPESMDGNVGGDSQKPSYLLDISSILRTPVAFEWVLLDISNWNTSDFVQQVEQLLQNDKLDVQWLDEDKKRASINASGLVSEEPQAAPVLIIVLEQANSVKKNHVKLLLNSTVAPTGPFSWQILKSILKHCTNLEDTVKVLSTLVREWKDGSAPELADGRRFVKNRFEQSRSNYQAAFNSTSLTKSGEVLTPENMAELVRTEGRNTRNNSESFERIDFDNDDIEFGDSESEEVSQKVNTYKIKCARCSNDHSTEMFELDDSWQCRDCLRQQIIEKIRMKQVPLEIPFVLAEDQSTYDILPAIIPLPLLNFYTKLSATELVENYELEPGVIGECPSCKQLIIVSPNEYNSTCCDSCGIHWCHDCGFEPHWPMTCSAYALWIEKWEKEYKLHILEKTDYIKKIKCCCGNNFEVRDKDFEAECSGCGRVFNPQTMKLLQKAYWIVDSKTGELIRRTDNSDDYTPQSVETVAAAKIIKKEFSEVCGQARKLRFHGGTSKKNEFDKCVRKMKNTHAGVEILRDLRKTVLVIVENGLGFVYMEKKKEETLAIKQSLTNLMRLWQVLEVEIQHQRTDFNDRVEEVQSALLKSLQLIKSFLEKTM